MRIHRLVVFPFLVLVALGGAPAFADSNAAQVHFARAQEEYKAGRFEAAATAFLDAHKELASPLLLFNAAAAYQMQAKAGTQAAPYLLSIDLYERYLKEAGKDATDAAEVQNVIGVLKAEVAALSSSTPPAAPSAAVTNLTGKLRGLVSIESTPNAAEIRLGGPEGDVFALTSWSGQLPTGTTKLHLSANGYEGKLIDVAPSDDALKVYSVDLDVARTTGVLRVEANVPGARVYLHDKARGVAGKTPYQAPLVPGPVKVIVEADGYDDFETTVEIKGGEAIKLTPDLAGAPVGYLTISGDGILGAKVYIDDELVCDREACRKGVRGGTHTIRVTRPGSKPFSRKVEITPKVETTMKIAFAPIPGRGDAIAMYVLTGVLAGGGLGAYLYGKGLDDDIAAETAAGMPPAADDARRDRADYARYGAYGAWGLSGVTLLTAIYYTFRDKGPASSARVDSQALVVQPVAAADFGGVTVFGRF